MTGVVILDELVAVKVVVVVSGTAFPLVVVDSVAMIVAEAVVGVISVVFVVVCVVIDDGVVVFVDSVVVTGDVVVVFSVTDVFVVVVVDELD